MEELIYILPFDLHGIEIVVTILIVGLVLFSIVMRLLKVPQKLMVIATGALAMSIYMTFQTDGPSPIQPLINLAQRQKQLDQQFEKNPLKFETVTFTRVKVRAHSLTLTLKNNTPLPEGSTKDDLEAYANSYLNKKLADYCEILNAEQELPYRKTNQRYFDLTIKSYYVKFIDGDKSAKMEIPVSSCTDKAATSSEPDKSENPETDKSQNPETDK
ncbi:hypothetical protein H3S80_10800 [Bartonella sp. M0177]|uniref:hypothetical protein n=1 Tax=Bartonella sp. M0177 TaxID=2750940 RepID=UPI0018DB8312|nr:hypothetical protein [Bartonella sp. M0177]MBI0004528.1 hypothetical protein [Bartonella sp. M0177]